MSKTFSSLKHIESHDIRVFGVKCFLFMSPITVCSIYFPNAENIILPICLGLLILGHSYRRVRSNNFLKTISILFYLPQVLSALWAILMIFAINNAEYFGYLSGDLISRVLHQLLLFIVMWGCMSTYLYSRTDYLKFLYSYIYGIFIILGIMGLWQVLHQLTGVWCPELETRGDLYFAKNLGLSRITSLANEPSYLAPFLIDGILISVYLRKYLIPLSFFLILICSLSFGGYLEIIVLATVTLLFVNIKAKIRIIASVIIVVVALVIIFPDLFFLISALLESRQELQSGFNPSDTSRTAMLVSPIYYYLNSGIGPMIFGSGPSSFKYLYDMHNDVIFVTSNNIYVDLLYEGGIIGVVCLLILLYWLWRQFKIRRDDIIHSLIPKLFIVHLILSSMYRADYSSPRYCAVFIILYSFYVLNKTHHATIRNNHQSYETDMNGFRQRE